MLLPLDDFRIGRMEVRDFQDGVLEVLRILFSFLVKERLEFLVSSMTGLSITDPPLPDAVVSGRAPDVGLTGLDVNNEVHPFDT